jgi:Ca-activated chloride channel family protein
MKTQLLLALTVCMPWLCSGDSGVIVPSNRETPDASVLAIDSIRIHVVVDNGHATVRLQEIFRNKTGQSLEGTYSLALPGGAAISDFAVWDDLTRIPGVILERKRASELYRQIRDQAIDPGLLESGEVTDSEAPGEARHSSQFSVKIVPIPAYGYKRLEAEYRQILPVTQLRGGFLIPLKPATFSPQMARKFTIDFELRSALPLTKFRAASQAFPLKIAVQDAHLVKGSLEAENFTVNDDFAVTYEVADGHSLAVQAYRAADDERGFFEASTILPTPAKPSATAAHSVIVLFDTSLSMQWEKLERSFQALETTLRALQPSDSFNVIVFNSDTQAANTSVTPATPEAVGKALDFVRASRLQGGTNLRSAMAAAFAQAPPNAYIVLLSDGELTEGDISASRFGDWLDKTWSDIAASRRPHLYALAIGDDANSRLLRRLASHSGVFEQVGSAESLDFKLASFIQKIGVRPLDQVAFAAAPENSVSLVYRLGQDNVPGSLASWVGQYSRPGSVDFAVTASQAAGSAAHVDLPKLDTVHLYLPATWARARVDALLEKIGREGEDKASIDEIIQLSRKYKFVTPYTSFLAAPRALLRPRLIRPGDPLLRVRTDPSIQSLVALFPFGAIQPLRFIKDENVWQTRFVAPGDMTDGPHTVRLVMRDRGGRVYREQKTFVISSHAPLVRVHLASARVRAGERVALSVQASQTTRTITARLYGVAPVVLRWDENSKSNAGILTVPSSLPAGKYSVHVTAEDAAHNVSHREVPLEILP